ncbi:hypothetical protein [Streptomyces sp. NBC_00094]|uniref:hypothetical protein n=1 Tax=Streptomyces sp. NBC_00094 TaxID=2903620 RepID=UPI002253CEAC|nr:hypothetical protein [Streptomyces sp. NBC_00094]MCX5390563.1 hypothetical protein [Streptomyces sp. NBC_00094]
MRHLHLLLEPLAVHECLEVEGHAPAMTADAAREHHIAALVVLNSTPMGGGTS